VRRRTGYPIRQYLVKWTGLGYHEATWEYRSAFDGTVASVVFGEQVRRASLRVSAVVWSADILT